MLRFVLFIGLLALCTLVLAEPVVLKGNGWSTPQNGLQGRFTFMPGEPFAGTRLIQVYLELHNTSNLGSPMYIKFDINAVKGTLTTAGGKAVSSYGSDASIIESGPTTIVLPYDSTIKLNVTAAGWGVPRNQLAQISLMHDNWVIKAGDTADYYLAGTFQAGTPDAPKDARHLWSGTLNIPRTRVDVLHVADKKK